MIPLWVVHGLVIGGFMVAELVFDDLIWRLRHD